MKKQTKELFDKLRQTLPTPQEKICEFTFYDAIGIQINDALENDTVSKSVSEIG